MNLDCGKVEDRKIRDLNLSGNYTQNMRISLGYRKFKEWK